MNKFEKVYQGLQERLKDLQHRVDKIKKDVGTTLNKDSEEQAIELENAEVLSAINEEAFMGVERGRR